MSFIKLSELICPLLCFCVMRAQSLKETRSSINGKWFSCWHRDPAAFNSINSWKHLKLFCQWTLCLPFFFSSQMFFYLLTLGCKGSRHLTEAAHWCKLNAVRAWLATVRAGYRTGTDGLWGFSWLSERVKGRLLSGGSNREHRPLSVAFVASWRPLLNPESSAFAFQQARWKHSVCKGLEIFSTVPGVLQNKGCLAHAANVVEVLLFSNGCLHAEWFVAVISDLLRWSV